MMSLVRAAKDSATVVLQERHMHMFNNNLQASDGRGPCQAERESKLRAQQEREADEFVDILDDDYAIILEAIMPLSLKQSNLKILSTTCPKLLKNTGQKN